MGKGIYKFFGILFFKKMWLLFCVGIFKFVVFVFSYVMGIVYSKVFFVVKEIYERDDKLLFIKSR